MNKIYELKYIPLIGLVCSPLVNYPSNPLASPFVLYFFMAIIFIYMDWRHRFLIKSNNTKQASFNILIALLMAVTALLTGYLTQLPVSLNGGLGFDGLHYGAIYEHFKNGHSSLPLSFPYHQRIGLPYFAALLPFEPRLAFLILHTIFWILTTLFFVLLCSKLNIPICYTFMAVVWINSHWLSVPRAAANYSFTVDSSAIFFMMVLTYFFTIKKYLLIILTVAIGAIFKETIMLWSISLISGLLFSLSLNLKNKMTRDTQDYYLIASLLVAISLGFITNYFAYNLFPVAENQNMFSTINFWAQQRLTDTIEIARYFGAIINAAGGFLAFLLAVKLINIKNCFPTPAITGTGSIALTVYLAICFFSGSDLTKFAFMSFPLSLPIILLKVNQSIKIKDFPIFIIIVILGTPVAHLTSPLLSPLPGHEVPKQDYFGPYTWMMEYAHLSVVAIWLSLFIFLLFFSYYLIKSREN